MLAVRVPHADLPLPCDLEGDARAARSARQATSQVLRSWSVDDDMVDTAALLVTELVNNAITHTGGVQQLRLRVLTDRLVLEVGDADPRPPQPLTAGPGDEGGRGLLIVTALTSDWGVRLHGTGKIAWCELVLGATAVSR